MGKPIKYAKFVINMLLVAPFLLMKFRISDALCNKGWEHGSDATTWPPLTVRCSGRKGSVLRLQTRAPLASLAVDDGKDGDSWRDRDKACNCSEQQGYHRLTPRPRAIPAMQHQHISRALPLLHP